MIELEESIEQNLEIFSINFNAMFGFFEAPWQTPSPSFTRCDFVGYPVFCTVSTGFLTWGK